MPVRRAYEIQNRLESARRKHSTDIKHLVELRRRLNLNRVFKCIFCEKAGRLSGEHVWADWLRHYLPRIEKHSYHWVSHNGGEIIKGKLHRPGDFLSQKLRVVCKECNSGWMSKLQVAVRPILVPLINDSWNILNEDDQYTLARWITMTSMVSEFSDIKTVKVPQYQRFALKIGLAPMIDWSIYIGRNDPEGVHPGYCNHFGWTVNKFNQETGEVEEFNFQSTTFTVGSLLVHVYMHPLKFTKFVAHHHRFAQGYDLRIIWPFQSVINDRPITSHGNESKSNIARDASSTFGIPAFDY